MALSQWEWIQFSVRWSLYLALSGVIGGIGSLILLKRHDPDVLRSVRHYVFGSALLGLLASFFYFRAQIGVIVEPPLSEMMNMDMGMAHVLWHMPAGSFMAFSLFGYAMVALLFWRSQLANSLTRPKEHRVQLVLLLLALSSLILAYGQQGHSIGQPWLIKIVHVFHIAIAAWWIGSLWPLWRGAKQTDVSLMKDALEVFGKIAGLAVAILLLCGFLLALEFIGASEALSKPYGQLILWKLAFVSAILMIAVYHKFHKVPKLDGPTSMQQIRFSIGLEALIAMMILGSTGYLSTFLGLPNH